MKLLKTRVISALVGVILLIAVVCSGQMVLGTAVFFVSMLAMYEYFRSLTNAGYRPVKAVDIFRVPLFCFFPGVSVEKFFFSADNIPESLLFAVFAMIVVLFSFIISYMVNTILWIFR